MNKHELKRQLELLEINNSFYSLDGDLLPDRMILFNSYNEWIVFYLDERGNRRKEKIFNSEDEACNYLYEYFKEQKNIEKRYH